MKEMFNSYHPHTQIPEKAAWIRAQPRVTAASRLDKKVTIGVAAVMAFGLMLFPRPPYGPRSFLNFAERQERYQMLARHRELNKQYVDMGTVNMRERGKEL